MGRRLLAGIEGLRDLSVVGDVRGLGMMCGIELVSDRDTKTPALGLGGRITRAPVTGRQQQHTDAGSHKKQSVQSRLGWVSDFMVRHGLTSDLQLRAPVTALTIIRARCQA